MDTQFDLIVIGTGTAGASVAYQCRDAGWEVAIVDYRPYGGTCALRGCDPKKVLVGPGFLLDWHRRMAGVGAVKGDVRIDWPALMRFKRQFTDSVPEETERGFKRRGIAAYHGVARFTGANAIEVAGETLSARHIVIATGAKPARLPIKGFEHLTTSTEFMELDELPRRIVFVGGGYISFEFGHLAVRAGSQVTILQRGDRPLVNFDPDLVGQLVAASREVGIDVRVNASVRAVEKGNDGLLVRASTPNGEESFETDMAVHGGGRVPEIDALQLEKAGVEREKKGISVNEYLQSVSNPAVYAAGDASASGLPLTPVAGLEADIVAKNLLEGNRYQPDYTGIPSVVFTSPTLARVGLGEQEAEAQGLRFRINHADTSDWYASRRLGRLHSGYKVLIEEETERILGAHLLGLSADEVINFFATAIRLGLKRPQLQRLIYSYPTHCYDVRYML